MKRPSWLVVLLVALMFFAGVVIFDTLRAATLPAGAKLIANVAYGADRAQRLDVYVPQGAKGAPVLIMVHGGGWTNGDKTNADVVQNKIDHFLPEGIIFISTDYRMYPQVGVMDEAADVAAALAYVQQHAEQWGGDPARVVVMGHSAGAHLTSLVTAAVDIQAHAGVKPWLGNVELDSAALNVVEIMEAPHIKSLYDPIFGTDPTLWQEASPTLRLTAAPPPMLMVCSTEHEGSCPQSQEFVDAAFDKAQLYSIDMAHGDINNSVGLPGPLTDRIDGFLCSLNVGCAAPPPPPKKHPLLCNWFGVGC